MGILFQEYMHCANGYTVKKMSDQPYPHLSIKSLAWKFLSTMRKISCFIISLQVLKNKCEDLVLPASSWSSEVIEHPSREDTWAQEKESGGRGWCSGTFLYQCLIRHLNGYGLPCLPLKGPEFVSPFWGLL